MVSDYKRTEVYSGPEAAQPKHMFVWLCNKLADTGIACGSILDVGAATGDFLRYAASRFPNATCEGLEYDRELVQIGNAKAAAIKLHHGDANSMDALNDQAFDAVFLTGTHSIFEDFRPSFAECIRVARPGGRVFITGLFNDYPVDARIHWRYAERFEDDWHPGYNLFSKASIAAFLAGQPRVPAHTFEKFVLPFDLEPQQDPIRSWTEPGDTGERNFRNGIMPLNLELLTLTIGSDSGAER
ncbi:methyltransferase family protein [Hoeflea halophila]|uniref:Methyltransferase family protein n=1 Tax=Hoeflea halophila TaxID=714899 RepID=A0A286ICR6_9HYPH|nr:class I SAM-dependent methyltransferase [Hoeflea halophila]SOE17807.1 methyltransferase family protein [Hoeflea halophila]